MTVSLWNLAAYTLQLAALVTVAFAATWMLRIRTPRHSLRFWQAVLAIALLLPLAQAGNVEPSALQVVRRIDLDGHPLGARWLDRPSGSRSGEHRPDDRRSRESSRGCCGSASGWSSCDRSSRARHPTMDSRTSLPS